MPFRELLHTISQSDSERDPPLWTWAIFAGWVLMLAAMLVRLTPSVTFTWICRG